jgi:hypothetical protein
MIHPAIKKQERVQNEFNEKNRRFFGGRQILVYSLTIGKYSLSSTFFLLVNNIPLYFSVYHYTELVLLRQQVTGQELFFCEIYFRGIYKKAAPKLCEHISE